MTTAMAELAPATAASLDRVPPAVGETLGGEASATSTATLAEGSPLLLLLTILREFNRQHVSYCYWKSSRRVGAALSGESDLDLLIARRDQHRSQAILLKQGAKRFLDVAGRDHPAVSSYLGYDEPSGRLVHLHLHFRLVVGEKLLKNWRLPWEDTILARAIPHPILPIRILDPASEALLLVTRAALELSPIDPVALRHRVATLQKFELDRESLAAGLDRSAVRDRAGEAFSGALAEIIADAVFSAAPLNRRRRLQRRIRSELLAHRAFNSAEARSRGLLRTLLWAVGALNERVLHAPRPGRRRAPGGGCVAAVVGVDGSGKSTVVATVRSWLQPEIDIMRVYFGTGDGRPGLLLWPFKIMVPAITRLLARKPKGASHGRVSDRAPGPVYSLLMMVWATAAAAEKRTKLRAAHRAASRGLVVISDRYPQDEDPEYNDGPLLSRLPRAPSWLRRLEAGAYALARRPPPDLVLKLEVSPQTAAFREPAMDPAVIRRRIAAASRLTFHGSRVVRVDAEQPLSEVIRSVKHEIWQLL